uniref:hypothetical protein n=1 Tax=Paraglaciecola sp. TaxID=1920173 RepID=UPI0030F3B89B
MEKSKKSTLTSAVKGLNKALFHTVGYYCDGMQKFVAASAGKCNINLQAASQFKPLILIVARRHYTELNRSYPLENRNEVKKLILLEYAEQRVYYKLGKAENGRIVANIWLFKGRVPASLLTVPESFILAARSTLGSILQINTQPKQFITAQNQLVHSQTSNQLITNANTFAMSVGMPSSFELDQIEADILPAVLVENLKN